MKGSHEAPAVLLRLILIVRRTGILLSLPGIQARQPGNYSVLMRSPSTTHPDNPAASIQHVEPLRLYAHPICQMSTPETWVPALGDAQHGFPFLSEHGSLIIKDTVILAASVLVMADSAKRLLAKRESRCEMGGCGQSRARAVRSEEGGDTAGERSAPCPRPVPGHSCTHLGPTEAGKPVICVQNGASGPFGRP
ncbi:DUF417 family protein [Burkholderia gladioli]|uniref:DUF417 family protein n=1 Tax=Burkholderia gladioli TaxID=28095 RepID=UPI00264F47F4|nr:DUF417 family protein [Burkholderia gladioli]MDN7753343.1 DUF417 family protein [Burkholderia gladioli]